MSPSQLLVALGWPPAHTSEQGALRWESSLPDENGLSALASVVVTASSIEARVGYQSMQPSQGRPLAPTAFVATWIIASSPNPPEPLVFQNSVMMGVPQPHLTSSQAIEQFQSLRALLNDPAPRLDLFGPRTTPPLEPTLT